MIPRHNILLYLEKYGDVKTKEDVEVLFDRINSSVLVFFMIINDLREKKFVECENLYKMPNDRGLYYLPDRLYNLKLSITPTGKDYIKRKIIGTSKKIEFESDMLDVIQIGNIGFTLPNFEKISFDEFQERYRGKLNNIDIHLAYFLLTGKVVKTGKIKVFISYSWDSDKHKKWVKSVANKLDEYYDVVLDQKDFTPGMNTHDTMKKAIIQADKVLVIFTPEYKNKAENKLGGVGYEFSVITEDLNKYLVNDKYIPVLREGERNRSIPSFMEKYFDYDARKGKFRIDKLIEILKSDKNI